MTLRNIQGADAPRIVVSILIILTIMVIVTAAGYFLYLDRGIRQANEATHIYTADVQKITDSLSSLRGAIGYGGFIHEFKNYVIRRDEDYARRAEERMDEALRQVDLLVKAFTDSRAVPQLFTIRSMILEYRGKLSYAVDQGENLSVTELDALVKVDDGPALAALDMLDLLRSEKISADLVDGDKAAQHQQSVSELGVGLVVLIALFGGFTVISQSRMKSRLAAAFNEIDVLIEEAPNAILTIGADGTIRRCNAAASTLFGYEAEELTGFHVDQLVPPGVRESHGDYRQMFLEERRSGPMTGRGGLVAMHKSGREISVEIDLSVTQQDGEDRIIAFIRDVSVLRQKNLELEEERKKAQQASEAKSQFMATMSHELRTPLNAVIGFSELVQMKAEKDAPKEELGGYAKSIGQSGKVLLSLINDILDFAKIDSGRFDISEEPFYLPEEIGNIHSAFEAKAAEMGVDLITDIGGMNNIVLGDSMRIKQVLYNLLDNAIKFGRGSTVKLSAQAKNLEGSKLLLQVDVADSGIGISTDRLEAIFDAFHQADATIARAYGGTGLGLSISRSLARLMGGDVTVQSEPGKGSTFTATFVLQDLQALNPQAFVSTLNKPDGTEVDFGLTVLAVDDFEPNLDVIGTVLVELGCKIIKTRNGEDAIKICGAHKPDMILMDIHMPVLDGISAASEIVKLHGIEKSPPIFAWTADVTCKQLLAETDIPWSGIIIKPTVRQDIVYALQQVRSRAA